MFWPWVIAKKEKAAKGKIGQKSRVCNSRMFEDSGGREVYSIKKRVLYYFWPLHLSIMLLAVILSNTGTSPVDTSPKRRLGNGLLSAWTRSKRRSLGHIGAGTVGLALWLILARQKRSAHGFVRKQKPTASAAFQWTEEEQKGARTKQDKETKICFWMKILCRCLLRMLFIVGFYFKRVLFFEKSQTTTKNPV